MNYGHAVRGLELERPPAALGCGPGHVDLRANMRPTDYLSYPHRRIAAEAAAGALISRGGERFLRKRIPPSLRDLALLARGLHVQAGALLGKTPWSSSLFPPERLTELAAEHEALGGELEQRYQTRALTFPTAWGVEAETSLLIYCLVRGFQPATVIEMGVGNGHSSYFILRALKANGRGSLHSVDIAPGTGGLVEAEERDIWDYRLIDRRAESLVAHLGTLPSADLCLHDAGHAYLAQYLEFGRLWAKLDGSGIMIGDDVDSSYGLIDFCRDTRKQPEILIDRRKAVAVISHAAAEVSSTRPW